MPLRLVLILAAVLLAGAPAAPAAPAGKARHVRLSGGSTSLVLDDDSAAVLAGAGVALRPVGRARRTRSGFAFPITYGRISAAVLTGTLRHNGGLRLSTGGRSLDLNNLRLNLDASPDLTAQLGTGKRMSIARVDLSDAQIATTRHGFSVLDAVISLKAAAATAFDDALASDAFAARMVLGTADVEARVRRR